MKDLAKTGELDNGKGIAILSLWVITSLFSLVKPENIEKAIAEYLTPDLIESNLNCFRKGLEIVKCQGLTLKTKKMRKTSD